MINKKVFLPLLLLVIFLVLLWPNPALANPNRADSETPIYFFWGDGCPHCAEEEIFLNALVEKYPQVIIQDYEVWYDKANLEILKKVAAVMGFEPTGVPVTIIGEEIWIGFREEYKAEMEAAVKGCLENTCPSPIETEVLSTPEKPEIQKNSDQV